MNNNSDDTQEERITPNSVAGVQANTNNQQTQSQDNQNGDNAQNNTNNVIEGTAIAFNTPSKIMNGVTEVISPDALQNVDLSNVMLLNDHDWKSPLAGVSQGTLQLNVDDQGLHFKATLPQPLTTQASDMIKNIQNHNISGTSFGFSTAPDGDSFETDDQGNVTRTINKISALYEISLCCLPAYEFQNAVKVDTRSYEKYLKTRKAKEEPRSMEKTIYQPAKKEDKAKIETRSFEDWLRSSGQMSVRDLQGLDTDNGRVLVPKEISTPVLQLTQDKPTLANYITRRQVSSNSGTMPVVTNQLGTLKTKKELAEVPDIDDNFLTGVEYTLQTYIGRVYVSEEELQDAVVPLDGIIKDQLQQLVTNTENAEVVKVLTGANNFQTGSADLSGNLDSLKTIKNTMLDPALDIQFVLSQSDFNKLDLMKDQKGDYLMQPSVTSPTGKSLFGCDVIEVADSLMPAGKMFVGSLAQSCLMAYKGTISATWIRTSYYANGFLAGVRADFKPIAKQSGVLVTVGGSAAASGSSK